MKSLSALLNRISNWKSLLLFLAAYGFTVGYILKNAEAKINALAGKTMGVIDLTMGFNPKGTLDMVANYGDAARAHYALIEMTADVAYPIVYSFMLGIILTLLYRNTPYARVNVLPFAALIFDYLENITIVTLLKSYPEQSMTVATLCEVFKMMKWVVFGLVLLLIVFGLIYAIWRRVTKV